VISSKNLIYIVPVIIVVVVLTVTITQRLGNNLPYGVKDYTLVFSDEFNEKTLDSSKWVTCYDWYDEENKGCSNYGNNELEWYTKEQVSMQDGALVLTAKKSDISGLDGKSQPKQYYYESGMVSTGNAGNEDSKWLNTYGYYEARILNPTGKGIWPAFWLLPQNGEWPPEIDIMEQLGDKPNDVLLTYFWKNPVHISSKDAGMYIGDKDFANKWHTYGVDWREGAIDWYVDGKKVRSIKSDNVPSTDMAILLNLAVGGNLPGYPDTKTSFPASMMIDYVRVYKSK
jgi:beta-glucanase (GH16 family)